MSAGDLVVVFGGSGFIGKQVVRALAKRGYRVRIAIRRPHLGAELRVMGDVGQVRLLLWSSLGFVGLALNNVMLVLDRLVIAQDLAVPRTLPALLGVAILLFGCIWDAD